MHHTVQVKWTAEIQMKWKCHYRGCNRNLSNCDLSPINDFRFDGMTMSVSGPRMWEALPTFPLCYCCVTADTEGSSYYLQLTFGTKTKHSITVVQKTMKKAVIANVAFCACSIISAAGTPTTLKMTTLYTDIPTYRESLSAGMLTCRVSHARKTPNNSRRPLVAKRTPNQMALCLQSQYSHWGNVSNSTPCWKRRG